jgi:ribonuclease D
VGQLTLAGPDEIASVVATARASRRLAIDTEFMSEGRYRALLCLVQIGVDDPDGGDIATTALIDPLAHHNADAEPLAELLADPAVEIVVHAGRQDMAILRRVWHVDPANVFDTQIAAGFAGAGAQMGYGNLLGSILGLRVGKSASFTRWDARPLTDEQLSYAAEDVAHLLELSDELQRRLTESGRLDWAREECRRIEAATDERDPETAWERLPRIGQLDPRSRAVAQALAAWRERTAATEDRPVGSVLSDPTLVELAKRHPSEVRGLEHIRGLHPSQIKKRGAGVLEAIAAGLEAPPIAREPARGRSEPGDAPLIALAEALLRARAQAAGLAYELLASRAELEQIVSAVRRGEPEPNIRTLSGWRRELVGDDLRDLLGGASRLGVGPDLKLVLAAG